MNNFGDGKIESRRFNINANIDHLKVLNTFDITLVQDNNSFAVITCGENIQPKVEIRVEDNVLIVDHAINNRWLSGYEKIRIELHFPSIPVINVYKPCKIEALDTLRTDVFYLVDWGNFADCRVSIDANLFCIHSSGDSFGSYVIGGKALKSEIFCRGSANYSFKDFYTDSCFLSQESIMDIDLNVSVFFDVLIKSSGNVYYTGEPSINLIRKGEGNLIKH